MTLVVSVPVALHPARPVSEAVCALLVRPATLFLLTKLKVLAFNVNPHVLLVLEWPGTARLVSMGLPNQDGSVKITLELHLQLLWVET